MTSENVTEHEAVESTAAVSAKAVDGRLVGELVNRAQAEPAADRRGRAVAAVDQEAPRGQPPTLRSLTTSAMTSTIRRARTAPTPLTANDPRPS